MEGSIVIHGEKISPLPKSPHKFLEKTLIIYGASNSGKTTVIVELMKILSPYIPVCWICAPFDRTTRSYSRRVPEQAVHYNLNPAHIEGLIKLQDAKAKVYRMVNSETSLTPLFNKVANQQDKAKIQEMRGMLSRYTSMIHQEVPDRRQQKLLNDKMQEHTQNSIVQYMKRTITRAKTDGTLMANQLSPVEQTMVKMLWINPRILIILDDTTAQFKKISKSPHLEDIFYAGRHNWITLIATFHSDTAMPASLRRNVFLAMFMSAENARRFFFATGQTQGMRMEKHERAKIEEILRVVFGSDNSEPLVPYCKLVYCREASAGERFATHVAVLMDDNQFQFGSDKFREYCSKVSKDETNGQSLLALLSNI
jgi:hypothetical protein